LRKPLPAWVIFNHQIPSGQALNAFGRFVSFSFGIAGEVDKAKQYLSDWFEIPAEIMEKIENDKLNPAETFLQFLKRLEAELSSSGVHGVLQVKKLIHDLEMYLLQRSGSVLIPVLEQYEHSEHLGGTMTYGRLRSVSVRVLEKNI
jgi:hypothetical protein